MTILIILSALLLSGFIILSCILFGGIPGSYSAFSGHWAVRVPQHNLNVWSVVTAVAALLIVPPMIEAGTGDPAQFLGFFAPLYLIIVSLTPGWDIDRRQHRVHVIGAATCAALALLWLILIRGHWAVFVCCLVVAIIAGSWTRTLPGSRVFWGEACMFTSVYVSLLIG